MSEQKPLPFESPEAVIGALAQVSGAVLTFVDRSERVRFVSSAAAEWLGMPVTEVVGKTLQELHEPASYDYFAPFLRRALAGERVQYERMATRANGEPHWISVSLSPVLDDAGEVCGVFSCSLEVNELKRTHDALGRALAEIANHIENTPLAVVEFDAQLRIRRWSPQAEGIFGWTFGEVRGKPAAALKLFHEDSRELVTNLTRELTERAASRNHMLARNRTKDGRSIWCEWHNSASFDEGGKLASILSFAQDVTARVESEEQLKQAAVHDALTGLPNRNSLASRLEHAILRVNRSGDRIALLFIDLDRFKKVNDTLGHSAGDEVLRQAAARIRACVREVDTVARLGGDEFVVLLEADVRPDTPGIIGERIRTAFTSPFEYKGAEVKCGASVGVSLYPDHARDPESLLETADEAMYRVKHSG
jgi:diguanylate cyclase (GGDEF)-like protein/PAS domain S-box-containing protein